MAQARAGAGAAVGHRAVRAMAERAAWFPGDAAHPSAGRQARADGHGTAQRTRIAGTAPDASRQRPQQPGSGAERAGRALGAATAAAAHRVLRHESPAGNQLRRLDGGARGRPAAPRRVPALPGAQRRGQRRLRGDGRGAPAAAAELPGRARSARLRAGPLRLPAPAAGGGRRQGAARRGGCGARRAGAP